MLRGSWPRTESVRNQGALLEVLSKFGCYRTLCNNSSYIDIDIRISRLREMKYNYNHCSYGKINTALALLVGFYTEPCSQMNACFQEQRLSFHRP